jgi:hypothetical protein
VPMNVTSESDSNSYDASGESNTPKSETVGRIEPILSLILGRAEQIP